MAKSSCLSRTNFTPAAPRRGARGPAWSAAVWPSAFDFGAVGSSAPWRAALARLALPLAAVSLAVWAAGVGSVDPVPLGKWWTLLLGGSLLAVIGAALRWRMVASVGAIGALIALSTAGYEGYFQPIAAGSAHFRAYFAGTQTDLDSVMLPAAVMLVLASLALPRRPTPCARALVTLSGAALPAVGLWLFAVFAGPSSTDVGSVLVAAVFIFAALVVIWCAVRRRHDPVGATLGAIVLAVAAPAGVVLFPSLLPHGGAWTGVGIAVLLAAAVMAPIACLALVGRDQDATTPA